MQQARSEHQERDGSLAFRLWLSLHCQCDLDQEGAKILTFQDADVFPLLEKESSVIWRDSRGLILVGVSRSGEVARRRWSGTRAWLGSLGNSVFFEPTVCAIRNPLLLIVYFELFSLGISELEFGTSMFIPVSVTVQFVLCNSQQIRPAAPGGHSGSHSLQPRYSALTYMPLRCRASVSTINHRGIVPDI